MVARRSIQMAAANTMKSKMETAMGTGSKWRPEGPPNGCHWNLTDKSKARSPHGTKVAVTWSPLSCLSSTCRICGVKGNGSVACRG